MVPDPKEAISAAIARAQAELNEALRELEKMPRPGPVGITTHALNNYLSVVGVAVQLIARRLEQHPDRLVIEWLNSVMHAIELMRSVVSHLTTDSVFTEGQLRFEKVDLLEALRRFCDFYQEIASRKLIRLIVDSKKDVAPVLTDRVAILSVLDNLISNAIKFSPPERRVWLEARSEDDTVVCRVRDEGPGLTRADQERLFQKGVRLTPRPTAGETSTGYGLAVAKDLMDKLGGTIWCESDVGQGATFFIRLQAYQEEAAHEHGDALARSHRP